MVVICIQTKSFYPLARQQVFVAERFRWSELGKKSVLYPIIISMKSQKKNCILLAAHSELRPFGATKKEKQKMLHIVGERALPKCWVHRDHGRRRDPKQHLPCGVSLIQWVTLNEREAFHRSPTDVNLVC